MNIEDKIEKNKPLAPLTTFQIGGPAEFFLEAITKEELEEGLAWARKSEYPVTILGGGSNVLVSDDGIEGLVITLDNKEIEVKDDKLICGAGTPLSEIINKATENGYSGLEWAAGIPGAKLGGAIVGNAGAFGTSMSEQIESVGAYDLNSGEWKEFKSEDCQFGYRRSIFKEERNFLIFKATLSFKKKASEEVEKLVNDNLDKRKKNKAGYPNAGSIFKNITFEYLKERNPDMAKRAEMVGVVTGGMIGAGWLIEQRDLKGKTIGGAQVSEKHCNFIVNKDNATALDVITLISYVKQKVRNEFNVQLQEEIQYLGF